MSVIGLGLWVMIDRRLEDDDGGDPISVTEKWTGLDTLYAAWRPSKGAAHATFTDLDLQKISYSSTRGIGVADLIYTDPDRSISGFYGGTVPPVGTTSNQMDSNPSEVPIEKNINWTHLWQDPNDPLYKPGVTGFMMGFPIHTHTRVVDNWGWTEAEYIANLNTRQNPTGLNGPTANAWLLWSRAARDLGGGKTEITEVWQYNPTGWDTDIYGPFAP